MNICLNISNNHKLFQTLCERLFLNESIAYGIKCVINIYLNNQKTNHQLIKIVSLSIDNDVCVVCRVNYDVITK